MGSAEGGGSQQYHLRPGEADLQALGMSAEGNRSEDNESAGRQACQQCQSQLQPVHIQEF
ncbi:hypothetical protein D3C87_2149300 [compost metagenome]